MTPLSFSVPALRVIVPEPVPTTPPRTSEPRPDLTMLKVAPETLPLKVRMLPLTAMERGGRESLPLG